MGTSVVDATFSRAPSHLYPAPHPSSTQANQAQLCLLLRTLRQQVIAYRTNPDICRSEGALQFGSASPSNFLSYPTNPITATTPSPTLHHHLITRLSLNRICPLLCLCSDISLLQCSSHCFYPQPQFNTVTSAKLPFSAFPSSPRYRAPSPRDLPGAPPKTCLVLIGLALAYVSPARPRDEVGRAPGARGGSAAEPVSGAAGVTCPVLGAAGSGGDRGPSSRRRSQLLSRCRHAGLLHHFLQGRPCALVLPGRERLMHRAR